MENWKETMEAERSIRRLWHSGMGFNDGNGTWKGGYILRMEIKKLGDGLDKVLKKWEEFRMTSRYFLLIWYAL